MTGYHMRASRVLERLRAGQPALTVASVLGSARAVESLAMSGFDCVWLDAEHVSTGIGEMEQLVRACRARDCDAMVRVPRGSYSDLIRPLESGAAGVMAPHVMSADEAREIARVTRFAPLGRRPINGGAADAGFTRLPAAEYVRQANDNTFVVAQIEDPEPLDELDAIAAVEGIDVLFFGPADFSHAIGRPGEMDHPDVDAARRAVADAACKAGKVAGTVASVESAEGLLEMGYRMLNFGADVTALVTHFDPLATAMRERCDAALAGPAEGDVLA